MIAVEKLTKLHAVDKDYKMYSNSKLTMNVQMFGRWIISGSCLKGMWPEWKGSCSYQEEIHVRPVLINSGMGIQA